jgi:hypothetical protein
MGEMLRSFLLRIKIDYQEWRDYQRSMWDVKRNSRAINRAMNRAREKNLNDGRTYYVLRDRAGGYNEFNSTDIHFWTTLHNPPLLDKMNFLQRIERAEGIVTCASTTQQHYDQVHLRKENTGEKQDE